VRETADLDVVVGAGPDRHPRSGDVQVDRADDGTAGDGGELVAAGVAARL
jgi:hypothetical protein